MITDQVVALSTVGAHRARETLVAMASFLAALFADGRVRVCADAWLSPDDLEQSRVQLLTWEHNRRAELPGVPPAMLLEAAQFGAEMLHRSCQFLVYREVATAVIQETLRRPFPGPLSSSAHYSADLTLRYLPDVVRLARTESGEDPLVIELIRLAGSWPLSAVGIAEAEEGDIEAIVTDSCLLSLYVDRIIVRNDFRRLGHAPVRAAALCALGAFPELAPEVALTLGVRPHHE